MTLVEELEKAGNQNDRFNIVLLKLISKRNRREECKLAALLERYTDNDRYERAITNELKRRGLVETTNTEGEYDESGYWVYTRPDDPKDDYTTAAGVKALNNKLFRSESAKEATEKRFRYWQTIGIIIAATGGAITILSLLYKYIESFLQ